MKKILLFLFIFSPCFSYEILVPKIEVSKNNLLIITLKKVDFHETEEKNKKENNKEPQRKYVLSQQAKQPQKNGSPQSPKNKR